MSFTKIHHFEKEEYADMHHDTALNVTEGVENQPIVNPHFVRRRRRNLTTAEYVEGILAGNITTLSQAITLIESNNPAHYAQAQEIIEQCLPHAGHSVRIGITGVPGAGKSTFIEAIGNMVTSLRHKLAVLAIDPSSERSGGSILGDKTRMESISHNPDVFIRPSPSAGSLGGVARKTRETIVLCEAAGFDVIFIETVGVGQSETAVHSMVDLFMLLQISGAGDELQGIKRGIMEMADLMVITKADGENIHKAELAKTQFQGALRPRSTPRRPSRAAVWRRYGRGSRSTSTTSRPTATSATTATGRTNTGCTSRSTRCCATRSTTIRPSRPASGSTKSGCSTTRSPRSSLPRSCWTSTSPTRPHTNNNMSREGPKGEARPAPKGGKATGRFSSLFTEGRGDFLRPDPNEDTRAVPPSPCRRHRLSSPKFCKTGAKKNKKKRTNADFLLIFVRRQPAFC